MLPFWFQLRRKPAGFVFSRTRLKLPVPSNTIDRSSISWMLTLCTLDHKAELPGARADDRMLPGQSSGPGLRALTRGRALDENYLSTSKGLPKQAGPVCQNRSAFERTSKGATASFVYRKLNNAPLGLWDGIRIHPLPPWRTGDLFIKQTLQPVCSMPCWR